MQTNTDDKLAASVFALGLTFGFVRREEVVRWADRRIEEAERPSLWLIDVSLSQGCRILDLVSLLKRSSEGVGPLDTCDAVYALLPDVSDYSFDKAEALAKFVYQITYECLGVDWKCPLLPETDMIADSFALVRDGYTDLSEQQAIEQLMNFIEAHRNEAAGRTLNPVVWFHQPTEGTRISNDPNSPLIHVGLSAWIIQDGNYGDFAVDQHARFALEFYPPHGLQIAPDGPARAERLTGSRYRVRGWVVFADSTVWVIDTGSFMAFSERRPPSHAIIGAWVEGDIYLGIDPFFYLEYLHRMEGMPPLTYTWLVRQIDRETTPWIEAEDAHGRAYRTRDESREAFVPTRETKAWDADGGNAQYVLACERLSGPEMPTA